MSASTTRLGLVILAVDELPRALRFWRDAFGFEQTVDTPVYAELALPADLRLGLYVREGFARNTGRLPLRAGEAELLPVELYLYPGELEAAAARVLAAGGRLLSALAPRAWGDDAAYFADPDGNVVVLARRRAAG